MKNRVFSTIVIVLLFTLAFLYCFRACVGAIDANIDGGGEGTEIKEEYPGEGEDNPSVADDGDNEETVGVEPLPHGEGEEKSDLKTYVEERIVPVITGVGAAIGAIFIALGPLVSAIRAIKNAVAAFSKKDEERNASVKESNRLMQKNIERIEASVSSVPALQAQNEQFKKQVDELKLVCTTLAQITALGFQANADVVRTGKGRKMASMLKKLSNSIGDIEGTFEEVKENDEAEI